MKKLPLTVAIAASAFAVSFAATSRADDTSTTTTTTQPPAQSTTVVAPPAAQPVAPAPAQPVIVQQPVAQPGTTTTTAAPYAPAPAGQEAYAEKSTEHLPNKTLLSTGVGIFVISYGASLVAGAVSPRDEDKKLFIPVVGPWIDLGDRSCNGCNNEGLVKGMLVTSGIVQGAGVLMGIASLVIPESTTTKERHTTAVVTKPEVHVTPVSYAAGAGIGAIGTF